jgi:hypothetical protein
MHKEITAYLATNYATYNRRAHTAADGIQHVQNKLTTQHQHQDKNKLYPLVRPRT